MLRPTTLLVLLLFVALHDARHSDYEFEDYTDHPCVRSCEKGAPPKVCEYRWLLENYLVLSMACGNCPFHQSDCFLPDCVPANGARRGIKTANRKLPGPAIQVCEGDTVVVTVDNRMELHEGTSIHWHGVLQSGSPHMDGVAMVTQCPIPALTEFTYSFLAENAGTHFWHAHSGFQRTDGLLGALVIRNPPDSQPNFDLYDFDLPEHVIILHDWKKQMAAEWFATVSHFGGNYEPDYLLINGLGSDKLDSEPPTPRATFKVQTGYRYRFRVIGSSSMECTLQMSIDNHSMTIIAADGGDVEPILVDSFNIYSGERYDFVLHADNISPLKKYWIRIGGIGGCAEYELYQRAILEYDGSDNFLPVDNGSYADCIRGGIELNPFNAKGSQDKPLTTQLQSTKPDDDTLTSEPDRKIYLALDFLPMNNPRMNNPKYYPFYSVPDKFKRYTPQINSISLRLPSSPPLSQFSDVSQSEYCNADTVQKACEKEFCQCVHRYQISLGDLVEIIVVDEGKLFTANHPFHLHGYKFRVLAVDKINASTSMDEVRAMDERGQITRLTTKAPLKDTVTFPDGGYAVLRFRADNPGVWLFHCHVLKHAENGMGLMFQVGREDQWRSPPKGFPTCGSWHFHGYDDDRNEQ